MSAIIPAAALLGLAISGYALYIELEMEHAKESGLEFKAACDIGVGMSCSAVLSSEYGKILSKWGLLPSGHFLDLPNAAFGGVFYLLALLYPTYSSSFGRYAFLFAAFVAVAFSAYLGYVLKYILKDLCLVCVSSYVVNVVIFAAAARLSMARTVPSKQRVSNSHLE